MANLEPSYVVVDSSAPLDYVLLPVTLRQGGYYDENGNWVSTVGARVLNLLGPFLHRPAGTFRVLAFSLQAGGGLCVYSGGVANLDSCNVYSNEAQVSARLTPLPGPFLQRPAGTFRVLAFLCSPILVVGSTSGARQRSLTPTCTVIKLRWVPALPRTFLQRPAELTLRPPLAGRIRSG